jgi:hypothetical protein
MTSTHAKVRRWLQKRGPYQLLAILAVPLAIVEPSKLVAVAILGKGHWLTGTIVLVCAYMASIFVIERLFQIAKPRLLTLRWFAKAWSRFISIRAKAMAAFTK